MPPAATILINSKDRKEELAVALESAVAQRGDLEVLVVDDGSSDGTQGFVEERFPTVRVLRLETARGVIQSRNYGVRHARGPIVVIVDDDCVFTDPGIVEQILREFDDPRIGAVASPYVDIYRAPDEVRQLAPDDRVWVRANFRGCAHALRRDLFLEIGGYEAGFIRQGEENLYIQRMLSRGFVVRLGRAPVVHHLESPNRNRGKIVFYGFRNGVLTGWLATPLLMLPLHLVSMFVAAVRRGSQQGLLGTALKGYATGLAACCGNLGKRRPLPLSVYMTYRALRSAKDPVLLEEVASKLPPLDPGTTDDSAAAEGHAGPTITG